MKMKFGAIVVDGRNKIGGHVASKNRAGAYLRTKVTPSNPRSTAQVAARSRFSSNSSEWRNLTAAQRAGWNAAVSDYKKTDIFGDIKVPSGFNLYQKLNNLLVLVGVAVISDAPAPVGIPSQVVVSATAVSGTGVVTVTVNPATTPVDFILVIRATAPQSAGKSFVKSEFRVLSTGPALVAGVYTATSDYAAKFGAPSQQSSKIFFEAFLVSSITGQKGQSSQVSCIIS
jgi:hypothetical protein